MNKIRSPICTVLGHVDHGKSTLLDSIRGTAIVNSEAGAITQAIGASIIPLNVIKNIAQKLKNKYNLNLEIPGILFIDTPGHEAFTNLRKRGGNLADIAILVIDITEGAKEQTNEALEILKKYKTPFIIAANKIDKIPGWNDYSDDVLENISKQSHQTITRFENDLYSLVGWLSEQGLNSERFDRITDFSKEVAIVPISAKTGQGIPELLIITLALVQKYLKDKLNVTDGNAKGTILEIKRTKGNIVTADVILYDGILKTGDNIIFGTLDKPLISKVRGLFQPAALNEMRDEKSSFKSIKEAIAATGVRIIAKELDKAVAGMPIMNYKTEEDLQKISDEISKSVEEVLINTCSEGVVIKADSLGSLEAMLHILKTQEINIKKASVGDINKKDIIDALTNEKPENRIILGFNTTISKELEKEAKKEDILIINDKVIYKIVERLEILQKQIKEQEELKQLSAITFPFKIKVLKGYIFRQSNPAVFGVLVMGGKLKPGQVAMNDNGRILGVIKSIQKEKDNVSLAERNDKVAISLTNATYGRQFFEEDIIYSEISEEHFRKLKELKKYLSDDAIQILKEIAEINRKENPMWGI